MYQQIETREALEAALRTWFVTGTGLDIVVQPGNQGAINEEHVVFQYINGILRDTPFNEMETLPDGSVQVCVISDWTVTYQVAVHHCRDGSARLERLLAYFGTGVWRRTLDTPNVAYVDARDISRSDYVEGASKRFQTLVDLDFYFRKCERFEYQSIESVELDSCADLPFQSFEAVRP